MKQKRDKEYYLQRAVDGFKTLIIYQCVTKPQFDPFYKVNGKFSKDKLFEESEILEKTNTLSRQYKAFSKHHNLAFGLDCRLVEKIIGTYRDADGKKVRISIDEVLDNLNGWCRCSESGKTIRKDANGNPYVVCWWKKKYFIADKNYWLSLLSNPMYSKLETYPQNTDGEVWAIKQIWKYRKQTIVKHYSSLRELMVDFATDKVDEMDFMAAARRWFKLNNQEIKALINQKQEMTNGKPKANENKTGTNNQDKQGQEISDETPSPTQGSDNPAPTGQGEKPICLDGLVQETQGLQEKTN